MSDRHGPFRAQSFQFLSSGSNTFPWPSNPFTFRVAERVAALARQSAWQTELEAFLVEKWGARTWPDTNARQCISAACSGNPSGPSRLQVTFTSGASFNGGASFSGTNVLVQAEAHNLNV